MATWPPASAGAKNEARSVINTSIVVLTLTLLWITVCVIVALGPNGGPGTAVGIIAFVGSMVGVPVFVLATRDLLERRVLARDARECWQDPADPC